jgi:three-Cys-motif partner protein
MRNPTARYDPEKYEIDEDGLLRAIVGPWVRDKHARLQKYVGISRAVRRKFVDKAGATYIDLFSGPGRARIRDTTDVVLGSPLVAWNESLRESPFTEVHVCDADSSILNAAAARLRNAGAPVAPEVGPAAQVIDRIISKLNPSGLHFAFLDPYNLESLPFELIRKLAVLERMDILMHVSAYDLQVNLRAYIDRADSPLDSFAPGWRDKVDTTRPDNLVRPKIMEYWRSLLRQEGMNTTEVHELVVGTNNQRLYWLAFAARHGRAVEFWQKIRAVGESRQASLL